MASQQLPNVPLTHVVVDPEFFGPVSQQIMPESDWPQTYSDVLGTVLAIFFDADQTQWCAFEIPELAGVHCIAMDSTFFKGWTNA